MSRWQRGARWQPWLLLVGVLALIALSTWTLRGRLQQLEGHSETLVLLQQFRQLDARLDAEVLKVRVGLSQNYDALVETNQIEEHALAAMRARLMEVGIGEGSRADSALDQLAAAMVERKRVVEQFKSTHAVLRNSLRFLPTGADQLLKSLEAQDGPRARRLSREVQSVTQEVLTYSLFSQESILPGLRSRIDALSAESAEWPAPVDEDLAILVSHARTALERQEASDALLARLSETPLGPHTDALFDAYSAWMDVALGRAGAISYFLLALAVVLLAFGAYGITALRRSRDTLEQRVVDRTEDLRASQEDLRRRVTELLAVVSAAADGDLTATVQSTITEDDLSQMAGGVQMMMERLRYLLRGIKEAEVGVSLALGQITEMARSNEAGASEQSATAQQIDATTQEIRVTSQRLAEAVDDVAVQARVAAEHANQGEAALGEMGEAMEQMAGASEEVTQRLARLSGSAARIGSVVTTITKVAEQTNLLSLNAAIEAEKAGEHGRGFSVIAREIRRLADRTAVATIDIERLITDMQKAVSEGVMGMERFSAEIQTGMEVSRRTGDQLLEITALVEEIRSNFDQVKHDAHSQSDGAAQISDAMSQLSQMSRQAAIDLRHSGHTVQQLAEAHKLMADGMARFTIEPPPAS